MKNILKVKKIHENAILPDYAHVGDVGMDLYSVENITIPPLKRAMVHTGIKVVKMPKNSKLMLCGKSGLASKNGIIIMGGVIDENYRGELIVIMFNANENPYNVEVGKKIAQGVISPVLYCDVVESDEEVKSERGEKRFGSSGLDKNKKD